MARGDTLLLTRLFLRGHSPRVRLLSRGLLNLTHEDLRGKKSVSPDIHFLKQEGEHQK